MSKEQFLKENQRKGEVYAGLLLGENGEPDQHIFLLPGSKLNGNHAEATKWAASIGGDLPTRREQSLLFANLKQHFEPRWYWSSEQHGSDDAWVQGFASGGQGYNDRGGSYHARAVRRVKIL